tara:strand:+ start:442 stop:1335 length:894 start_codon:yes stop_codon:yes gene_type:complete
MTSQSTNHVLLIRPAEFYCNEQTIETNHYQNSDDTISKDQTLSMATSEFDQFKKTLVENQIRVSTLDGNIGCPDNIFPNWAVTYSDKNMHIFSMLGENRRLEKSQDHIEILEKDYRLDQDYSPYENEGLFLEGTSSLVMDRINRIAYMGISARSNLKLAQIWSEKNDYKLIPFETSSHTGGPIYHSDVMMYIGTELAVVCKDSIANGKSNVIESLRKTHELMFITQEQLLNFCGNCIEVKDDEGRFCLIMSSKAFSGYDDSQIKILNHFYDRIIHSDLETIETHGGGSARCMIMELY